MTRNQIIGITILAVGVVLLGFAYHTTNAPMEHLSEALTGRYSDQTMWFFAVGIAVAVGGGLLVALGSRK